MRIFPLMALMCCTLSILGSKIYGQTPDQTKPTKDAFCVLPGGPFEGFLYVPPEHNNLLTAYDKSISLTADYLSNGQMLAGYNCSEWSTEAQAAFDFALDLWEPYLDSPYPITVRACWSTDLGGSTLGLAGPSNFWLDGSVPNVIFPAALAEYLFDIPNQFNNEIIAVFNANQSNWYFASDGNPGISQFDFVTVVMHEVGHGLGFLGQSRYDDGVNAEMENPIECNNMAGHGCLAGGASYTSIYSQFIQTDSGTPITNIANPSADLGTLFTGGSLSGGSGGLFLASTNLMAANDGERAHIHTPNPYVSGSSYSHFDDDLYPNELMQPILNSGQAIHAPGLADDYLHDLGWGISILPVELVQFDAKEVDKTVSLNWETAVEINNQGFAVERSRDARNWTSLGFVPGQGDRSTPFQYQFLDEMPEMGVNYYRLVQTDWDGTLTKSKIVQVNIFSEASTFAVFPNPAKDRIQIKALDASGFPLNYQVFNSVGQRIQQGRIQQENTEIESTNWPSGVYHLVLENGQKLKLIK